MTTEGTASLEELERLLEPFRKRDAELGEFPLTSNGVPPGWDRRYLLSLFPPLLERQRALETALREAEEWIAKRKALNHASRDRYRAAHPEVHRKSARESMARTRARARAAAPLPPREPVDGLDDHLRGDYELWPCEGD